MSTRRAYLALADGTVFPGKAFGSDTPAVGEVVFTTGMTGYQEVLTDPSYTGQIVAMTAPQIGNTGINSEDAESVDDKPQVAGFVLREESPVVSNYRSQESLDAYLARNGIIGISEIDTRKLTRHLRDNGSQNGTIGTDAPDTLVDRARSAPNMEGLDLVALVSPKSAYEFKESRADWGVKALDPRAGGSTPSGRQFHVVAYDYGAKRNILRCLVDSGFKVTVVPASTTAEAALRHNPDGIFLSNGPGDPAALPYAVESLRGLLGKKPIFGICLGHQLLARALGASTYKLKFGHRGLNQPVKDLSTNRVEITTQNHGFVVDVESIKGVAKTTHLHLNDGTSEGLEAPEAQAFSVQYHPEAAAGPHDALYLFDRFRRMMDR
ncbi:MAG TPA: glutamine-hydrolyzing carbamoyl-phosphate synthase small subunit [Polyangiaceae bacterium]|nr:glutamine-hydrolyzing carbamoyl-phosphate synthase small subunit [Polyangiaceae bacterium]